MLPGAWPTRVIVAPLQLSVTVGSVQVATAFQAAIVFTVMLLGQATITGDVTSSTVKGNEQDEELPLPSVTVIVIV